MPVGFLSREPHDQLLSGSKLLALEKGGVTGLELSRRPDEAFVNEYELKLSRICCSSLMGFMRGDEGHWDDVLPEANGELVCCQPGTLRMSADV